MNICITNGKLILQNSIIEKNLYIKDGIITEISNRKPTTHKVIDAGGKFVSPGFIDHHTHGRGGSDTMYPTFDDLETISTYAMKAGATSILPTTVTSSIEDTRKSVENFAKYKSSVTGAKMLGMHLEGPFFNAKYKGAQPEEYMLEPTKEAFYDIVGEHISSIAKISMAPELPGAIELGEYLHSKGIIVSIGHSDATYEQAFDASNAGYTSVTHVYNAMTPLTHRAPGIVGAAMVLDNLYAELILDGIHVGYPAAKAMVKAKGVDKVTLITDSLEASGLPDGKYKLGSHDIYVKDNAARLADGTLAGSVSGMNKIVYNAYKHLELPIYDAVKMATIVPATALNRYDIGELAINKVADIIIFDENIDVSTVIIDGEIKLGE